MKGCDSVSSPVDYSGTELPQKHDSVFVAEFIISRPLAFTQGLMGSRGGGGGSGGWWQGISISISLAAAVGSVADDEGTAAAVSQRTAC